VSVSLLAIGYALMAALLLNIWIATRWSTAFKVSMVLLASLLYIGTYVGLKEIQGWPTTDPLPDAFRLLWAKIDEPDKRTSSDGQIYLWVQLIDAADRVSGEPRVFKLPYRIELAEEVEDAIDRLEAGATLNGRRTRGLLKQDSEEVQDTPQTMAEGPDATGFTDGRVLIEFMELPATTLPAKAI
jgi:hypothetical protein